MKNSEYIDCALEIVKETGLCESFLTHSSRVFIKNMYGKVIFSSLKEPEYFLNQTSLTFLDNYNSVILYITNNIQLIDRQLKLGKVIENTRLKSKKFMPDKLILTYIFSIVSVHTV